MDNKNAPYNEVEHSDEELEIFVSVVISKIIKVKVSDYTIVNAGIDENRIPYVINQTILMKLFLINIELCIQ